MATLPKTEIEKKAWNFAKKAHYGVRRKFGNLDYFDGHVAKVFGLVKQFDTRQEMGAAALLHDTVEDVDDVEYETILEEFGKVIADLVKELTSCDEILNVMGKKDYLLDKMATMTSDALIIKLCDRLQNVSDFYNTSDKYRSNYYKETKHILDSLSEYRVLNKVHLRIIERINGMLSNIKTRYKYESIMTYQLFLESKSIDQDCWKNAEIGDIKNSSDIHSYVYSLHRNEEDFEDGDITDRIYYNDKYQLCYIPLSEIEVEYDVDYDYVKDYIEEYKSTNDYPPIVLGYKHFGMYDIIDGTHRAEVFNELKMDKIKAWVAIK